MDMILWRHAEASDPGEGQDDLDRPLTSKGERQAARMATWLQRQLPSSTRVLVSPARRAQQTAAALDRKFKTVPAVAPTGTVDALLASARWPESREPVLVVGHQPVLGLAASYLLCGQPHAWTVRKGGVIWLRHRKRGDVEQVLLVAAVAPELL
jgi:phosphohistidine phosphatase